MQILPALPSFSSMSQFLKSAVSRAHCFRDEITWKFLQPKCVFLQCTTAYSVRINHLPVWKHDSDCCETLIIIPRHYFHSEHKIVSEHKDKTSACPITN